jgi:hypothetical protein
VTILSISQKLLFKTTKHVFSINGADEIDRAGKNRLIGYNRTQDYVSLFGFPVSVLLCQRPGGNSAWITGKWAGEGKQVCLNGVGPGDILD